MYGIQCCGSRIRCLFEPWIRDPGWVKIRIRIQDHISESLETIFWVKTLKFLMWIRDPGWKKSGSEIRNGKNPDPGWFFPVPYRTYFTRIDQKDTVATFFDCSGKPEKMRKS
jgi:hypothetical protein